MTEFECCYEQDVFHAPHSAFSGVVFLRTILRQVSRLNSSPGSYAIGCTPMCDGTGDTFCTYMPIYDPHYVPPVTPYKMPSYNSNHGSLPRSRAASAVGKGGWATTPSFQKLGSPLRHVAETRFCVVTLASEAGTDALVLPCPRFWSRSCLLRVLRRREGRLRYRRLIFSNLFSDTTVGYYTYIHVQRYWTE